MSFFSGVWHLVAPDFTYPGVCMTSKANGMKYYVEVIIVQVDNIVTTNLHALHCKTTIFMRVKKYLNVV